MDTTLVSTDIAPADRISQDDAPPDLSYLNGFASEDLACNREGRLSENQRLELRRAINDKVFEICAVLAFALFNLVVFHAIPFAVMMGGFVVYYAVRLVERVDELQEAVVCEVVGDAWPQYVPDSEGPDRYWLHIGGLKLEISDTTYATFRSGGPYRIYYLASTNTVIGGEILPDWRPVPAPQKPARHWWQKLSVEVG